MVRLATENRDWGYDRIAGALANVGREVSDQTVGNILKRHGIPPAPEREKTTTWREFIRSHFAIKLAGTLIAEGVNRDSCRPSVKWAASPLSRSRPRSISGCSTTSRTPARTQPKGTIWSPDAYPNRRSRV